MIAEIEHVELAGLVEQVQEDASAHCETVTEYVRVRFVAGALIARVFSLPAPLVLHAQQKVPFHWAGVNVREDKNNAWLNLRDSSAVNSPAHYTRGTQEAIDIIEEAIQDAPDVKSGMLQAQVLKYLLRLWLKDDPKQDAEKARWYLNRLIDSL